ncbi:hypothetical protein [Paenibacillus sp. JJ-100]|nr:hypothetical protein [Paenibacillus sp. JJ-100]
MMKSYKGIPWVNRLIDGSFGIGWGGLFNEPLPSILENENGHTTGG